MSDKINESRLGNSLKALGDMVLSDMGNKRAQGRMEFRNSVKKLLDKYDFKIGRGREEPNKENIMKFLINDINFDRKDVINIFKMSKDPLVSGNLNVDLTKSQIEEIFSNAIEYAYNNDMIDDENEKSNNNKNKPVMTKEEEQEFLDKMKDLASDKSKGDFSNQISPKMKEYLKNAGMFSDDIEDLKYTVDRARSFKQLVSSHDRSAVDALSVIGYAFLKQLT